MASSSKTCFMVGESINGRVEHIFTGVLYKALEKAMEYGYQNLAQLTLIFTKGIMRTIKRMGMEFTNGQMAQFMRGTLNTIFGTMRES